MRQASERLHPLEQNTFISTFSKRGNVLFMSFEHFGGRLSVKISHVKMHVPNDLCGIACQTTWISTIIGFRISNLEVIIWGHDRIQRLCVKVQKIQNNDIYPITKGKITRKIGKITTFINGTSSYWFRANMARQWVKLHEGPLARKFKAISELEVFFVNIRTQQCVTLQCVAHSKLMAYYCIFN
jgi:hypothetical protein